MIELNDFSLDYDGTYVVSSSEQIEQLLIQSVPLSMIKTLKVDSEIKRFNFLSEEKVREYSENDEINLDFTYKIPKYYAELDLDKLIAKLIENEDDSREARILNEYQEFKKRDLLFFLKTIIFVIDEFKKNKVVWGVGRGSSCASYLLYKLGLHSVDSVKYNIPMHEFFH